MEPVKVEAVGYRETAKRLGISVSSLRHLIEGRRIVTPVQAGGVLLFSPEDITKLRRAVKETELSRRTRTEDRR